MEFFTILYFYFLDSVEHRIVTKSAWECSELMDQYIDSHYDLICHQTDIPSSSIRPMKRPALWGENLALARQ